MNTYIIGDIQGCLTPLKNLLDKIHYHESDQLLFTGDLVNRGPDSLGTLRFIKSLPSSTICVLGNHDLNLLCCALGFRTPRPGDTIQDVLEAEDKAILMDWLRRQPLLYHDEAKNFVLTHAGLYPLWDLPTAKASALEVEKVLQSDNYNLLLKNMYGNYPSFWEDRLEGWDRLRFIINAFTRMRFCTLKGELDLAANKTPTDHPTLIPWFDVPERIPLQESIFFGHWAALNGKCHIPNIYPLDTGCVWGHCLSAYCLETQQIHSVPCQNP